MNHKYFPLCFDDGTPNDERLVPLLNRYGIKASFHLNAGMIPLDGVIGPNDRLPLNRPQNLYAGHEIAAHGFTHPFLTQLTPDQIKGELDKDIEGLNRYFSQTTQGFAYPFGVFNETVIEALKSTPLLYARTIRDTHDFDLPKDPYLMDPTCHILDERLDELTEAFLSDGEDRFFLIWGHSYELRTDTDWERFESFLKRIAHHEDVFYGSILECLKKMNA
jgi:peptidoglycan/xylan/chitin deacetylase (PgdA/CDA1 family)